MRTPRAEVTSVVEVVRIAEVGDGGTAGGGGGERNAAVEAEAVAAAAAVGAVGGGSSNSHAAMDDPMDATVAAAVAGGAAAGHILHAMTPAAPLGDCCHTDETDVTMRVSMEAFAAENPAVDHRDRRRHQGRRPVDRMQSKPTRAGRSAGWFGEPVDRTRARGAGAAAETESDRLLLLPVVRLPLKTRRTKRPEQDDRSRHRRLVLDDDTPSPWRETEDAGACERQAWATGRRRVATLSALVGTETQPRPSND